MIKQIHTYAVLELSSAAYQEIADKLRAAGYDHAFHEEGKIDMFGIAVAPKESEGLPIPVSRSLPDNPRFVLMWFVDSQGLGGWQIDSYQSRADLSNGWGEARAWGGTVTHWCELPQPIKV